ncbi:MAG TPA: RNA 3'-terminal phosphate cyclase [Verrucomicrobiae bacterium]|nr:RNA 3'-terminal phosphate cyclase [Verrucomicrobiae bacterium]
MITIDGSQGEGGGQILRTALALALVTGQAFRIEHIRAGRKKPGLLRQHLTAVEAATRIGNAEAEGAEIGSLKLTFKPGKVSPGEYAFAVGTAGSATLVLQTVLPALMLADEPSALRLEGGTHNPFAPPFDFLTKTFLPVLNRMGPTVTATLERPGFYPAGGGRFQVSVQPVEKLKPIELLERGELLAKRGRILLAHLPEEIGARQARMLRNKLNWPEDDFEIVRVKNSAGPGNVVMAEVESESVHEVFTGFGERDVPSGKVVGGVIDQVREFLAGSAPVGEYLADQLMIPLALAGGGSYRAIKASLHARTNAEVIGRFLERSLEIDDRDGAALFQIG